MSSQQVWNSDTYQRHAGFVSVYGEDVLAWLDPQPGERVLDLGCGDGALTRKLVDAGADVVGVDASENFVATARASGLEARVMDGQTLEFEREFDAVFTNAALHWMPDAHAVIAGVARALKPGGRFVGEFGGFGNVAALCSAMHAVAMAMDGDPALANPWFFPTRDRYARMLVEGGFDPDKIETFARPTPLPGSVRAWLEVMRKPFFDQFGAQAPDAYDRVIAALQPNLCDDEGRWTADYVRLRFSARLR